MVTFDMNCSYVTFADKQNLQQGNIWSHSDYYLVALEPQGRYAIGFHPDELFIYDLDTFNLTELPVGQFWPWTGGYKEFGAFYSPFVPHAMSTNGSVLLVAGYLYDQRSFRYVPVVSLFTVDLGQRTITLLDTKQLVDDVLLYPYQAGSYGLEYGMSVDLNTDQQLGLVGVAKYDQVILVRLSRTKGISFVKHLAWKSESTQLLAGKSVAWLNNRTAAVLFYSLASRPWSPSQIQVCLARL